jgi:hypothetical protein
MDKIKAILFLIKCVCWISWRVLKGQKWNMIQANLENPDGTRLHVTYQKTFRGYEFYEWNQERYPEK